MDLCLRGSQINLIERKKSNKINYYYNFNNSNKNIKFQRPYSALTTFDSIGYHYRHHHHHHHHSHHHHNLSASRSSLSQSSSSILTIHQKRPMSADNNHDKLFLRRNLRNQYGVRFCEISESGESGKSFERNNKFSLKDGSSSNILKLLLNEPIKRSWLCDNDDYNELIVENNNNNNHKNSRYKNNNKRCEKNHKINFNLKNKNKTNLQIKKNHKNFIVKYNKDEIFNHQSSSEEHEGHNHNSSLINSSCDNKKSVLRFSSLKSPKNFKNQNYINCKSSKEFYSNKNSDRMSYMNNNGNSDKYYSSTSKTKNSQNGGSARTGSGSIGEGSRSGSGSVSGSGREGSDYWHSKKPDLPGRVSFGKTAAAATTTTGAASNISKNFHLDYSDGEIDIDNNQINDNNNFTKTTTTTTLTGNGGAGGTPSSVVSMSASKKSVHFGGHTEVVPSASTSSSSATCHQYTSSSCSNENCPCVCMKTTTSTTLINPDKEHNHSSTILEPSTSTLKYFTTDNKCEYDDNDDYCGKGSNYRTFSEFSSSLKNDELQKFSSCKEDTELLEKESKIIQNYKNEIDDESKKLQLEIKMAEKNDKNNDNYDGIESILDARYRNLLSTTTSTTIPTTTTSSSTGNILLSPTGTDNNHHHLHLHHYHHRPSISYEGLSKYETELQQQQQQKQQKQQQQTDNNSSKTMQGQLKNNLSTSTTRMNEISNDKQQNNNNNNNNNNKNHHVPNNNNNNNTVNLETNCNNSNKNNTHKSHDNKTSQTSPPSSAVQQQQQQQSPPASLSVVNNSTQTLNPIINNYLKVSTNSITTTASPKSSTTTKKLNNSINTKRCKNKQCSATSKSTTSTRSKSVSSVTDSTVQQQQQQQQKKNLHQQKNLKKSETFSCLRQDSNLDEFHLDNIDSWMSIQQCNNPDCHDSNCMNKKYQQQQQQQQQHRHHYHHHFSSSPKDSSRNLRSSGDAGGGGDGYTKHCHHFLSSSVGKYESHDDTDTPEHFSKTTEESTGSQESSETGTTYDEIISVIKEMEEEKKKDIPRDSSTDLDIKFQNILQSDGSDISTVRKDEEESPDKLKDILSYLEDVENSCERTLLETRRSLPEMSRSSGAVEFTIEPDIEGTVPKIADLIAQSPNTLARRIIALTLRSNELTNAIQLSREHLARLRQEKQKSIRIEKQNTLNRLREQKKHYENMLARHQGFIEQLLKDKGSLCDKVTTLTRRIESQNQAWEHKLETEIARAKEIALAGEKIRRERWVRENTKKIKDLTVKGVEVEIEKMNAEHKKEITELKKAHQQELSNALEDARQKHEQIIKSIREQCAQDREAIIEKERSAIRERFERQLQEEQKSFDEQKSKLLEDFASERERLLREIRQKDEEFEKRRQEFHKEKELIIEQIQSECNERLEQQEQKYQNKINAIEKQFESDFLIWKREFENACKLREVENENGIRQHYRAERDRQIDAIVSRMDAESQKSQEEFELKLSRLKEKYDSDLREVECVEKSLRDKYNETRNKLAESNAEVQNLQAEIKQLQIELEHSRKMCDEFLTEKESMKENVRNEVQVEIATIKSERDEEIKKIHKRVQQAIEKKDAAMEILQKDNTSLRERCMKLEQIIRQQRKDYCVK